MTLDQQAVPPTASLENSTFMKQLEQDRAAFIGAKYPVYYQQQFAEITPKKPYAGFNVGAFFFGVIWLFYRKMYLYAVMAMALMIVIGVVETFLEVEGFGSMIGLSIAFGVFGNGLYKHHVDKQIAKIRQFGHGDVTATFQNAGGTNWVAALIPLLLVVGITGLAIMAA